VSKIRRIGLRPDPRGGWPLDKVLVGVATLRTLREVFLQRGVDLRAWDVTQSCGVSPQGAADALDRLARAGLVETIPSPGPGYARSYRLDPSHPLAPSLGELFSEERRVAPRGRLRPDSPS